MPITPTSYGTHRVTFTCMIWTDGTSSTYGVYRGKLHITRKRQPWLDSGHAERVATVAHIAGDKLSYGALAVAHQTPDYPAFNWWKS